MSNINLVRNPPKSHVHMYLLTEVWKQFKETCEAQELTASEVTTTLYLDYITEHRKLAIAKLDERIAALKREG